MTLKRLTQTALATVADVPATVSFAGAVPALAEGINQLNLKLDDKTPSGPSQPLILAVGNNSGPATRNDCCDGNGMLGSAVPSIEHTDQLIFGN